MSVIEEFVEGALAQQARFGLRKIPLPDVPEEMRDESAEQTDDWIPWKAVPSTVTEDDLADLEGRSGLMLPQPYREFLQYKHFYSLTEAGVRFARHPIGSWKNEILSLYAGWCPERIVERGLLPFGDESFMDAGPTCFDMGAVLADGDAPVVFWDHEWVGTAQEVQPLFSSSLAMFRALLVLTRADINVFRHFEDDDPEELPRKRAVLREFLEADADGAGDVARGYWTAWGVNV